MDGIKNILLLPCLSAYHLLTMQPWCRNHNSSPNPINSSIGFFIQRGFKWFKYLFKPILSCKWTILVQYLHVPLYLGILASFFLWIPLDWPCLNAMTFSSNLMKFHIVHEGSLGTFNKWCALMSSSNSSESNDWMCPEWRTECGLQTQGRGAQNFLAYPWRHLMKCS